MSLNRAEKLSYYLALALTIYMPLHIFLSQSLSLVTGGLDVWKAAKDIVICVAVPFLLLLAYKQGAFKDRFFRRFALLGGLYVLLYVIFLLFDKNADTQSAITASVYNTRPLGYLLLGYVVANSKDGKAYAKSLIKTLLIMCLVVAGFGVAQYFLPKDILTHVGYSLQRGVKFMFFIDDKPDFPRVMSTLRDPNSLGAFLAIPITYSVYFLFIKRGKQAYKVLSDRWLQVLLTLSITCLIFTFSRSGAITNAISLLTLLFIVTQRKKLLIKKYAPVALLLLVAASSLLFVFRQSYVVQNLLLHADTSTIQEDPNELRLSFGRKAVDHIRQYPFGEGPGTAGLVAISNPKGGVLTENYYLQIAYEVGVVGIVLFLTISYVILRELYKKRANSIALVLFCTGIGIAAFGVLNHSWSNESLAFVWWFFAGVGVAVKKPN